MNSRDKISFSIVVDRELRKKARPKEYWQDLGGLFVDMAKEIPQERLNKILEKHKLGLEIVEVLPE